MPPYSSRTMLEADWAELAPYFTPEEFRHPEKMGYDFMRLLLQVRKVAQVPMIITSDWRSHEDNAAIYGSARDSAHCDIPCDCVDIRRPKNSHERYRMIKALMAFGFKRMLEYKDTGHIHIDKTEHKRPGEIFALVDRQAPR